MIKKKKNFFEVVKLVHIVVAVFQSVAKRAAANFTASWLTNVRNKIINLVKGTSSLQLLLSAVSLRQFKRSYYLRLFK